MKFKQPLYNISELTVATVVASEARGAKTSCYLFDYLKNAGVRLAAIDFSAVGDIPDDSLEGPRI